MDLPFRPYPRWTPEYPPAFFTHGSSRGAIGQGQRARRLLMADHQLQHHHPHLEHAHLDPTLYQIPHHVPIPPPIVFETALPRLKAAVAKAIEHYTAASAAFAKDIELIKPYAPSSTVDELWRYKLTGKRSASSTAAEPAKDAVSVDAFGEDMRAMQNRVMKAMLAVAKSRVRANNNISSSERENRQRAIRKVGRAFDDCREIFEKAGAQFGVLASLLKELELVKAVVEEFKVEEWKKEEDFGGDWEGEGSEWYGGGFGR